MRTLKCISTGAKSGNCYLLDCDGDKLLLDAGVMVQDIKIALNWSLEGLQGVIISHCHTDHNKSESGLRKTGLPILAPYHNPDEKFPKAVFGNYIINCFPLPHNETTNFGFLIRWKDFRMCYLTDLEFCKYKFQKQFLNCLLVECNHIDDLIDADADNFNHIVKGHASLDVTEGIVKANSTENLSNVILCHLSEVNADEDVMRQRIEAAVPPFCKVDIAHKGEVYQL